MFTFFYLGPIISLNVQLYSSEAVARRCSVKKVALGNFTKFIGKHLCQSLFFNKVADLRSATSLKRGSGTDILL